MDKIERCTYCGGTYPHQSPTGCWNLIKKGGPGIWSNDDPYIVWPYYIGRDKGPHHDGPQVPAFFSEGRAWQYIIEELQPSELESFRVMRISMYLYKIRMQRCEHPGVFATGNKYEHCFRCGRDIPMEEL